MSLPRRLGPLGGLLALLGLVATPLALTDGLVAGTLTNSPSTFAATALYSPTALTSAWANCTGICYKLSWTAPTNNNGNGYAISGVNNGTSSSCPTTVGSYTTYVGSTASTSYTDSGSIAMGAQATYACYLVQSAYNPAGAPPWGSVPSWASQASLATIAVKLGIYSVRIGSEIQVASGNVTPTLPAASAAGNLLVFTGWNDSCPTCGFSAPAGWQLATRIYGTNVQWTEIWYYPFNPGGISSATFSSSGGNAQGQLSEFSGVYGTSPLDQVGSLYNAGSVTTATVSTSAATTVAGDLAVTNFQNPGGGTFGASPSGWSNLFIDNPNGALSDYQLTGSPAIISERATYSVAGSWGAAIATFKATRYAIARVQNGADVWAGASGNVTPTLPAASTAGNLLVFTGYNNSCATCGFSAPAGWVRATRINGAAVGWVEIWYYANNPGGISSAAFTSSGTKSEGDLSEYSGAYISSVLDPTGTFYSGASSTSATVTAAGATTVAGDLVVTAFKTSTTGSAYTSPSGWTHLVNDTTNGVLSDYILVGNPQTASERATRGTTTVWAAVVATFK